MKYCKVCGLKNLNVSSSCKACGGPLIDASEIENLPEDMTVKFSTACCPNPHCQDLLALPRAKYCSECGVKLQRISYELWVDKYVTPVLEKNLAAMLLEPPPPEMFLPLSMMGLSREKAKEHLAAAIEKRTGVNAHALDRWILETRAMFERGKVGLEAARRRAMQQAAKMKMTLSDAAAIVDRLAQSGTPSPEDVIDDAPSTSPPAVRAEGEAIRAGPAPPRRRTTRVYKLRKEESANGKFYLSPYGVEPPSHVVRDDKIYLVETEGLQRTFVMSSDANPQGWILTEREESERGTAYVRPVSITRLSEGRWRVDHRSSSSNAASIRAKAKPVASPAQQQHHHNIIEPALVPQTPAPGLQNRTRRYWEHEDKYLLLLLLLGILGALIIGLLISWRVWN
jgi:hypothetical protein